MKANAFQRNIFIFTPAFSRSLFPFPLVNTGMLMSQDNWFPNEILKKSCTFAWQGILCTSRCFLGMQSFATLGDEKGGVWICKDPTVGNAELSPSGFNGTQVEGTQLKVVRAWHPAFAWVRLRRKKKMLLSEITNRCLIGFPECTSRACQSLTHNRA